jgi:hypothetical protein
MHRWARVKVPSKEKKTIRDEDKNKEYAQLEVLKNSCSTPTLQLQYNTSLNDPFENKICAELCSS